MRLADYAWIFVLLGCAPLCAIGCPVNILSWVRTVTPGDKQSRLSQVMATTASLSYEGKAAPADTTVPTILPLEDQAFGGLCRTLRFHAPSPQPWPSTCHSQVTGQCQLQAAAQGKAIHSRNGGCWEGCCGDKEGLRVSGLGDPDIQEPHLVPWPG